MLREQDKLTLHVNVKTLSYEILDLDRIVNETPVQVHNVTYELNDESCSGKAHAHYLFHELPQEETQASNLPLMIRGYLQFEGMINGNEGTFLAQEDGVIHEGIINLNGRIVDASHDLVLLTGHYEYITNAALLNKKMGSAEMLMSIGL